MAAYLLLWGETRCRMLSCNLSIASSRQTPSARRTQGRRNYDHPERRTQNVHQAVADVFQ